MAQKVVLSDASPLIGLAAAGAFELLRKLFRRLTAGVLLAAKRAGLVKAIRPLFETLAATDFRLSDEVVRTILQDARET